MRKHIDENTGRQIRVLTSAAAGAQVPYFRCPRRLPDGRVIALSQHEHGSLLAVDPESGDVQPIHSSAGRLLRLREADGRAWFVQDEARAVWSALLPDGEPEPVGSVPEEVPGGIADITCDGSTLILADCRDSAGDASGLYSGRPASFWRWIYRPRSATLWAYHLPARRATRLLDLEEYSFQHIDTSPTDPDLLKYAQDGLAVFDQRIHLLRTDGSGWLPVRPQAKGEWVHHEFWWPGGQLVGYKYMNRVGDWTIHELPWGEYAPRPLQLGIANLQGEEIYLSDPLNCYHSHLNVSADGQWVCGEGTHNHCFVSAAPFSLRETHIPLMDLATIHTPYVPGAAQGVETGFSADNRWLIYNDTVDGVKQVCAVRVEG